MTNLPQVVPVLDLQRGQVVRGVAGQRQAYQPLQSRWTASCEPAEVTAALLAAFQPTDLYLADLDAITAGAPNLDAWRQLSQLRLTLWVDAGRCLLEPALRTRALAAAPGARWILGLESVRSADDFAHFAECVGELATRTRSAPTAPPSDRLIFSLDLRAGRLNTSCAALRERSPQEIVEQVQQAGFRRLIVLDLADVGVGAGVSTCDLVAQLRAQFPQLHLTAGGGVRGPDDLAALGRAGCAAALVASALHDGRLTPEMLGSATAAASPYPAPR